MYFSNWGLKYILVTNIYILIISKIKAKIKALKRSLIRKFKIKDLGLIKYFIRVKIT